MVIDYTKEMVVLAILEENANEVIVGMGQYFIVEEMHTAEVAFVVRDDYQGQGIGAELIRYLTLLAKRSGLHGFVATVLMDNKPMLQLFEQMGFVVERRAEAGMYELKMSFREG